MSVHAARPARAAGFTLVELLTAVAIFALLSGMLFQMVKNGLDVWSVGEGNRESLEKGTTLIHEIAAELRMVRADSPYGDPDTPVRMIADYGLFDFDEDQRDETLVQKLRFVRACPEERFDNRIREAGDIAGGDGITTDIEARESGGRAPAGMAEVGFATVKLPSKEEDPALLTLLRWFQTPIGGDASLFAGSQFESSKRMMITGVPLADNVLYLGFEFWSRDTESWESPIDSDTGPLSVWDSTRGVLLEERTFNDFLLSKDAESESDPTDDVFPRRVRITLVVEKDDDEAQVARLVDGVTAKGTTLRIDRARLFEVDAPHKFVKVEGEWMRWSERSGDQLKVTRGARRTAMSSHPSGARVHIGRTFQRTVEIPVYREDWNDE